MHGEHLGLVAMIELVEGSSPHARETLSETEHTSK
ncbi:hypothetical protein BOCO_0656 [Bombiscardovia coagulans]|uniref:Uncharacterized protein n=1 Tax=Bombiscardovia coagulans TaxID=686666 RepID=A0A261ETF4_9BIFI|nr:hypothetical protein BOCO_0656 [Bombiscardovia coagulans]